MIDKIKNEENVLSLEAVEVVLAQWNLVDNQSQQKSKVLYNFIFIKSHAYLLNVEPSNVVLKTYNTEIDGIIYQNMDQNVR